MSRATALLFAPLMVAASGPVQPPGASLDQALKQARAEQAQAEAQTAKLEKIAAGARGEAERLQADREAAVQGIEAAEARITAADTNLRLISATAALRREQLQREQQPIASLLAGLVMMARRPPLFAVADQRGTDELVKVKVLLDSTIPVMRRRTAALSAQLAEGKRLESQAAAARAELLASRHDLVERRDRFASLEEQALKQSGTATGQALSSGDVALAASENVAALKSAEAGNRAAWAVASDLAEADTAPLRPNPPEGGGIPALPYLLPAPAAVVGGLGSVDSNGVRARGLTLATAHGARVIVPASGTIKFAGPYASHDGVVIIDHGHGWVSLIVNVATTLKPGDRVTIGQPLGTALSALEVQLSQNGRRLSPALIAGSSQSLSNKSEGG